jgi:hypothetical protein
MDINPFLNCLQVFCRALSQSNRNECDVFMFPVAFFYIISAWKGGDKKRLNKSSKILQAISKMHLTLNNCVKSLLKMLTYCMYAALLRRLLPCS